MASVLGVRRLVGAWGRLQRVAGVQSGDKSPHSKVASLRLASEELRAVPDPEHSRRGGQSYRQPSETPSAPITRATRGARRHHGFRFELLRQFGERLLDGVDELLATRRYAARYRRGPTSRHSRPQSLSSRFT